MRVAITTLFVIILGAHWPISTSAADGPSALSHNPFSRPSSEVIRVDPRTIVEDGDPAQPLALQATMVGRSSRLANVAGRILKTGDDYQGYRLVAIQERYAVFERDGRELTVYVKPLTAEDDD